MSLLDQPPLDLTEACAQLADLRSLVRRRAAIGLALALLGGALVLRGEETVGIPFLIGAGAAGLLVFFGRDDRRRVLVRLVSQDDGWAIEEVRRTAAWLVSPAERRRLASGLRWAAEAAAPRHAQFSVVDPFRAGEVGGRLRRLATAIEDVGTPLQASGAALCRRLLGEGLLSPLYNPNLAEAELDRVIERIERALSRDDGAAGPSGDGGRRSIPTRAGGAADAGTARRGSAEVTGCVVRELLGRAGAA